MKLISMTDFVLEQDGWSASEVRFRHDTITNERFRQRISNYANFLKQPLTLGMFVPCDENENIMAKPNFKNNLSSDLHFLETKEYQKAKSKVIFKDFYFKDSVSIPTIVNILQDVIIDVEFNNTIPDMTIEDLVHDNLDLSVSF